VKIEFFQYKQFNCLTSFTPWDSQSGGYIVPTTNAYKQWKFRPFKICRSKVFSFSSQSSHKFSCPKISLAFMKFRFRKCSLLLNQRTFCLEISFQYTLWYRSPVQGPIDVNLTWSDDTNLKFGFSINKSSRYVYLKVCEAHLFNNANILLLVYSKIVSFVWEWKGKLLIA